MDLRTVPRTALDTYLKTLRLPVKVAERALNRDESRTWPPTLLADRAEATVRGIAGRLWDDPVLTEQADRLRLATDDRERALRLRAAAEAHRAEADQKSSRKHEQAARIERTAQERADAAAEAVEAQAQRRETVIAEQAAKKKTAVRRQAAAKQDRLDQEAKQKRLQQLDREVEVLDLTAAASTQERASSALEEAAATVKARRKAQ